MNFERLYFLREEKDLTQEEIGKLVGTKKVSVCNWEKGREIIPLKSLNIYANFFNVSMDYILGLSDDKKASKKVDELDKVYIGKRIKEIRTKNKLSQRALAKVLNTTGSNIASYELGKTLILTSFAYEICNKYKVSLDWLCGRE